MTTLMTAGAARVRRAADEIESTASRGRFRRRRMAEPTVESERLVLDAVERAKAGDDDAIRFLYLRYADNVYGYVCSIVRDEHETEDVTQLVFPQAPDRASAVRAHERSPSRPGSCAWRTTRRSTRCVHDAPPPSPRCALSTSRRTTRPPSADATSSKRSGHFPASSAT
jgi:hypothetical protein